MPKITIELDVEAVQEIASTIRTVVKRIDWTLDNKPPSRPGQVIDLDNRAKLLTKTATLLEQLLHQRALAEQDNKVVKIK